MAFLMLREREIDVVHVDDLCSQGKILNDYILLY